MVELTQPEARVLGALIEKQRTTPDYYPLTLNALCAACNQKSNRSPVVSYDEKTVVRALDALREKRLVWMLSAAGGRVPKYEHRIEALCEPGDAHTALLCLLMLRGPQTAGELRGRSGRLCAFETVSDVEGVLEELAAHESGPYVVRLPVAPGKKEHRYAHLLCGTPAAPTTETPAAVPEDARKQVDLENARLDRLENQVAELAEELGGLRRQFDEFRSQFE